MPDWDYSGVVLDARAIHDVGWTVANSDLWPQWYEGNPFRAIRAESADMRP
jgi:Zn-dependent M28 family amino/carboxypeptidase